MPVDSGLPIVTERLVIRPYEPGDVDALFALRNDPDVARYQAWSWPYPREKAERLVAEVAALGTVTPGEWVHFAVTDRATGVFVGDLPLDLHQHFPVAEIGYSFATAWQGQGLATEAAAALVAWLFEHHHLRRLEAYFHPDNLPSARLLERLGFRFEGVKRLSFGSDDDPSDDPVFGLLRADWVEWNARPRHAPERVELVDLTADVLAALAGITVPWSQQRSRALPSIEQALIAAFVPQRTGWCRAIVADGDVVGLAGSAHPPLVDRLHQGRGIEDRVGALYGAMRNPNSSSNRR